ncbi:MAG: NUDIX hydrolase [Candidatus Colwellbacteria bacterium]|nr:NUDIX hydrolase [Candidatus Colwellbacteria bacterium]
MSIPRVGVLLAYQSKDTPTSSPEYLCVYQDASKLWGFPKGRWKNFETYTQGACRELLEETGIKIHHTELSTNNMYHIKRGKHHHYYFVKEVSRKPVVTVDGEEIIGYKWMTISDLSKMSVSYFTDQVIKKLTESVPEDNIDNLIKIIETITFRNNITISV